MGLERVATLYSAQPFHVRARAASSASAFHAARVWSDSLRFVDGNYRSKTRARPIFRI